MSSVCATNSSLHSAGYHVWTVVCCWLASLSRVEFVLDADSLNVLATLLVVGSMDKARSDILGSGNLKQSTAEQLSQVCQHTNQGRVADILTCLL